MASPNPLRKTPPSRDDEHERDEHAVWVQGRRGKRVLDQVGGGVSGGEGDRDHEIRGGEPEQAEHEQLARPPCEQPLQHGDRTLAVRAFRRDAPVDRQCAHERDNHEDQRGNRGERACGERGDPRLVAERGKVIYPREAHHRAPRLLIVRALARVWPLGLLRLAL